MLGRPVKAGAVMVAGCRDWRRRTVTPRPTPVALANLHDTTDYFEHRYFETRRGADGEAQARLELVLNAVRRHFPAAVDPGRRILDIGCDTGDFLMVARQFARLEPF